MILGVRKKKNDFLFSLRYICLLPCGVPQKTRNGYCKLKSLACLHMGIAEETSRIRSGSSWWKYVGRKSGHTGTKGKTHAACTRPGFHAKFSYFPVTSYLFHLPFFISGEYGNLKTLARRRKQYHKCSPSLHPTFIDTDILYFLQENTLWVFLADMYHDLHVVLMFHSFETHDFKISHSPSEHLFVCRLLRIKTCINYSLVEYKKYYTLLSNNTDYFTESKRI